MIIWREIKLGLWLLCLPANHLLLYLMMNIFVMMLVDQENNPVVPVGKLKEYVR